MSPSDLLNSVLNRKWNEARKYLQANNAGDLVDYTDELGKNALHYACIHNAKLNIIKAILNASETAPLQESRFRYTPLHEATEQFCSEENIIAVLEACPQAASIVNIDGNLPLHLAIRFYKLSNLICHLLAANPTAAITTNFDGSTPLFEYFRKWNVALRNRLVSIRSDMNAVSNILLQSNEMQRELVGEVHETALLFLRAATCCTMEEKQESSFRPLHVAISMQHCPWSFINLILKMDQMQAYEWDQEGNLPIHIAAAAKSSYDADLYRCWRCKCGLKNSSWNQHESSDYLLIYCQNCFQEEDLRRDERKKYTLINPVDKIPAVIRDLLTTNPKFAQIPNCEERLLLHIAIQNEITFKQELKTVFQAAPEALNTRDIKMHLYPFMLGALQHSEQTKRKKGKPSEEFLQKFTSCYALLMKNPVLVDSGIPKRGSKRNQDGDEKSL